MFGLDRFTKLIQDNFSHKHDANKYVFLFKG